MALRKPWNRGGIRWHTVPDLAEELCDWLRKHFPSILSNETALHKNKHDTRVACADGLFIKELPPKAGLRSFLRQLVYPRVQQTFELGRELSACNVHVPESVAWGIAPSGKTYLVTREIENAHTLDQRMRETDLSSEARTHLLCSLGRLLASFHCAGYSNRDMKNTNVLTQGTGKDCVVYAIDLEGVRRRGRVKEKTVIRDFWRILHALAVFGWDTPETRLRILEAYKERTKTQLELDDLVPLVNARPAILPGWRCSRILTGWSGPRKRTLTIHSAEPHEAWVRVLHTEWLYRVFETGRTTRPIPATPVPLQIKEAPEQRAELIRFPEQKPAMRLTNLFFGSPAARALRAGDACSPKPIALVEEHVYGLCRKSALLVEPKAFSPNGHTSFDGCFSRRSQ